MAAEDKRTSFPRLPTTIRDSRPSFLYVRIPAGLFDTGTGAKQICNLPKGTRVLDCKSTITTALVGTAWTFDVDVNDGTTTTILVGGQTSTAVNTARVTGATGGEVLLNGATTNVLRLNVTTATSVTTTPALTVLLTLARETA